MTPEQWRKVDELFNRALEVAPEERPDWLAEQCAGATEIFREVESLLASDGQISRGFVQGHVQSALTVFKEQTERERRPLRAGPYRLIRVLGSGGMGTVYLAERDDDQYETEVAVKIVRPGMDTDFILDRFRRERQILAHLSHPNIARLLDGGTTEDGLPYIVMEYVDGVPITDYCDTHHLSIEDRLRLFLDVCAAVDCAHRNFVVHRDLKPGNILVDRSGAPKLLDFGICKLLQASAFSQATVDTGVRMMTPDYASPEQVRGDAVTIQTDIYSLGAILYELLTGVRALRIEHYTPTGLEKAICETDVVRPSEAALSKAVAARLRGDLDTILLQAMEKEPKRRYASVERFADDLRRYLDFLPVRARPATAAYLVRKFVRRNRVATASISAVTASLLAGAIISAYQAHIARQRLTDVHHLASKIVFDVHDAVKDLPGSTKARQMILTTGLQYLDTLAKSDRNDLELQHELAGAYQRFGDVQGDTTSAHLGDLTGSLKSYQRAEELFDHIAASSPEDPQLIRERVAIRRRIASNYMETREGSRALGVFGEAMAIGEKGLADRPDDVALARELGYVYTHASDAQRFSGDYRAANESAGKAIRILSAALARTPNDNEAQLILAMSESSLGMALMVEGKLSEAHQRFQRSAAVVDKLVEANPTNTASRREQVLTYGHLGDVLGNTKMENLGDHAGAVRAFGRAIEAAHALYQVDPENQQAAADYAITLSRQAGIMGPAERTEKIALLRKSNSLLEELDRKTPGNANTNTYLSFNSSVLGDELVASGDKRAALEAYRRAFAAAEVLYGRGQSASSVLLILASRKLGELTAQEGDRARALEYGKRALSAVGPNSSAAKGSGRLLPPRGYAAMGYVYRALGSSRAAAPGDHTAALDWLNRAVQAFHAVEHEPFFANVHRQEMKEAEAALALLRNRSAK